MNELPAEFSYINLLAEIKDKIRTAQIRAMVTVNQQLLLLYWEIGKLVLERQKVHGWGAKVVERLAYDLHLEFPDMQGYSKRNLLYMRQFAEKYPEFSIVQAPLAQLSWYHNMTLLQKCPDEKQRLWYAAEALENGWSRDMMVFQIERKLFERQGSAPTNFQRTLPKPDSDLAQQTLKDPISLIF